MELNIPPEHVSYARNIARGWMLLGLAGFTFAMIFAISHYCFGVPIHEAHTNRDATPAEVAITLGALTVGFGFFGVMGALGLSWLPKP